MGNAEESHPRGLQWTPACGFVPCLVYDDLKEFSFFFRAASRCFFVKNRHFWNGTGGCWRVGNAEESHPRGLQWTPGCGFVPCLVYDALKEFGVFFSCRLHIYHMLQALSFLIKADTNDLFSRRLKCIFSFPMRHPLCILHLIFIWLVYISFST